MEESMDFHFISDRRSFFSGIKRMGAVALAAALVMTSINYVSANEADTEFPTIVVTDMDGQEVIEVSEGLLASEEALTGEETLTGAETLEVTNADIKIDGNDYAEGMELKEDSSVVIFVEWEIRNISTVYEFEIALPEQFLFDEFANTPVNNGDKRVGSLTVAGHTMKVQLDQTALAGLNNLKGTIKLDCAIDLSKAGDAGADGLTSFIIWSRTFKFAVIKPVITPELSLNKEFVQYTKPASSGQLGEAKYKVVLTSKGINNDVVLRDTGGTKLSDFQLTDCSLKRNGGDTPLSALSDYTLEGTKITLQVPLQDKDVLTVTYTMKVDPDKAYDSTGAEFDGYYGNTVTAKSTEVEEISRNARVVFPEWKVDKKGEFHSADNTMKWTVTIDTSGDTLVGTKVKDTFGTASAADHQYTKSDVAGDVILSKKDESSTVVLDKDDFFGTGITISETQTNQFSGPSGVFYITYVVTVDHSDLGLPADKNLPNSCEVSVVGMKAYVKTVNGKVPGDNCISKAYGAEEKVEGTETEADKVQYRIPWTITIQKPRGTFKADWSAEDHVVPGTNNHKLDASKDIEVKQNNAPLGSDKCVIAKKADNSGFTMTFKEDYTSASEPITVTYWTIYDFDGHANDITNEVWLTANGKNGGKKNKVFKKTNAQIEKDDVGTEADGSIINWRLKVSKTGSGMGDTLRLVDTLPEGTVYMEDSAYVVSTGTDRNEAATASLIVTKGEGTVTFELPRTTTGVDGGNWIHIIFKTEMKDAKAYMENADGTAAGSKTYRNHVGLYNDQILIGQNYHSVTTGPKQPAVTKDSVYSRDTTPYVDYRIDVNTQQLVLGGGNDLNLKDSLGTKLSYVQDSFQIFTDKNRTVLMDASEYSASYDKNTNMITASIPDHKACYISYQAKINLPPGTVLTEETGGNKAELLGTSLTNTSAKKLFSSVVLASRATASGVGADFTLRKFDSADSTKLLPDAKFHVWAAAKYIKGTGIHVMDPKDPADAADLAQLVSDGNTVDSVVTTDSTGKIKVEKVKYDYLYALQETEAPEGYVLDDTVHYLWFSSETFNFADDHAHPEYQDAVYMGVTGGSDVAFDVYNQKSISVSKKVIAGSSELAGAVLRIYDDPGENLVAEWVSGTEPKELPVGAGAGELAPGKYTLVEEKAPFGYKTAEKISFEITPEGKIRALAGAAQDAVDADGNILTMYDEVQKLLISKKAVAGTEELAGASLKLIDAGKTVVAEWVSGTEPKEFIIGSGTDELAAGNYTLVEETAPEGFVVAESIAFTVNSEGAVVSAKGEVDADRNQLTMRDAYEKEVIFISKKEVAGSEELPGASLQLLDETGKNILFEWVSSTDPQKFTIGTEENELPAGNYILKEKTAPKGYRIAARIPFTVTQEGIISSEKGELNDQKDMLTIRDRKKPKETSKDDSPREETESVEKNSGSNSSSGAAVTSLLPKDEDDDDEGPRIHGPQGNMTMSEYMAWVLGEGKNPNTGDDTLPGVSLLLMMMAAVLMAGSVRRVRR